MKPYLIVLKDLFGIYQFEYTTEVRELTKSTDFYSFTKTGEEISVVCKQSAVRDKKNVIADKNWKIIKIKGPLSLSSTGIIAGITGVLGNQSIPVFVISTFNTDFILVKDEIINKAVAALKNSGYEISYEK